MRNLKKFEKFENFDGFSADEEADQMNNDQIFAGEESQDEYDAQAFGGEETEEEEGLELDEVVDRVLAAIEECGEECDQEEVKSKVKAVLADFHNAQESQEEEDDNYDPENDEDFGAMRADGSDDLGYDDEEGQEDAQQYEGLKKFSDFK